MSKDSITPVVGHPNGYHTVDGKVVPREDSDVAATAEAEEAAAEESDDEVAPARGHHKHGKKRGR